MTTLTKIEVRIAQFMILCASILASKRWFSWLLKIPVFILFVFGFVITRPYEWVYAWLYKQNYGKDLDILDIVQKMMDISYTEPLKNIVDIFM